MGPSFGWLGWLGYIGDDILPSYIGITIKPDFDVSILREFIPLIRLGR